jgi:choline dehydrogenase-like flavoprotein
MKIIDANELQTATALNADICIVGTGAAGITLASELDETSYTVCLIESGGYGPDEETQALYDLEIAGHPVREHFMSRARYFGGTCNVWAGRSMRLSRLNITPREWIPESGWPIPYEELAQYYGTTRMSTDPRQGVVDAQCQVHGVNNLFIAGSAVFPTSGHANPTLTLVALAIRLAERFKDRRH